MSAAVARHRAKDFSWGSPLALLALALAVYAVWGFVLGPVLVDLIGLRPTQFVAFVVAVAAWRWC